MKEQPERKYFWWTNVSLGKVKVKAKFKSLNKWKSHLNGDISDGESSGFRGLFFEEPNAAFRGLTGLYILKLTLIWDFPPNAKSKQTHVFFFHHHYYFLRSLYICLISDKSFCFVLLCFSPKQNITHSKLFNNRKTSL